MALTSGVILFLLLIFQLLTGLRIIKGPRRTHQITGYVLVALALLHGLGNLLG